MQMVAPNGARPQMTERDSEMRCKAKEAREAARSHWWIWYEVCTPGVAPFGLLLLRRCRVRIPVYRV